MSDRDLRRLSPFSTLAVVSYCIILSAGDFVRERDARDIAAKMSGIVQEGGNIAGDNRELELIAAS